jgi:hypothetical protein
MTIQTFEKIGNIYLLTTLSRPWDIMDNVNFFLHKIDLVLG